ncbi:hypothetical protein NEMBOFW57_007890 [Staphylotrichum longicolle]|uniref:DNA2/NAM7 helicase-like C-terminal domain-containing protein n=1 Tax=Staphylotrichum longicolle TaxID=669026 RepID=A0AAD4EVK1_9PEZI|nr:hypothetical protein NEMBOFW57_007890 [Staphylotrichum longicolle]
MDAQLRPIRVFKDLDEFATRHKAGTEAEFEATQRLVDAVNKEENKFKGWVVSKIRETSKRLEYIVAVQPGRDGERKIPQPGEPARLRVVFGDNSVTRFWDARRIETPLALLNSTARHPEKLAVFQVTVYRADAHEGIRPLADTTAVSTKHATNATTNDDLSDTTSIGSSTGSDSGIGGCEPDHITPESTGGASEDELANDNAVRINFLLMASEATKNAELGALELLYGRYVNASERQIKAFEYFVLLREPEFFVDLFEEIPHLKTAMGDPSWANSALGKKFALLNQQQKAAYMHGFRKLHCGICILPGGPGAGKTHFNLFTIAMAQSNLLPRPVMVRGKPQKRCAKVLFIVDMNCPVDDVCNRMIGLYKDLGMKKSVIRMKAPSLDEAAWQRYDEHKDTKYEELTKYLEGELWENSDIVPLRFRNLVYGLYRDTLDAADFIATTPVAASNHFRGMFKPDLVYFDEAPHARELMNLIAIANFDPIAWIFCGDHRQTIPFVGSDVQNIYRDQMQVSMMERAARAKVIPYQLLVNHRAFGDLQQLASEMWYGGEMISGNDESRTPATLSYTRQYLERFMGGRPCTVPRLLVHMNNCGPEAYEGTSAWNPDHNAWVMARVHELLNDAQFTVGDKPGTILIISPYKKAFNEYQRALKKLPAWAQKRVEARTVDVVQGHEADFVFLDLVKGKSTKFLDNANRLCVAITRARLGEVIMMRSELVQSTNFQRHSRNLRPIYDLCKQAGQVVYVDPETTANPTTRSQSPVPADHSETMKTTIVSVPNVSESDNVGVGEEHEIPQLATWVIPTEKQKVVVSQWAKAHPTTNLTELVKEPINDDATPTVDTCTVDEKRAQEAALTDNTESKVKKAQMVDEKTAQKAIQVVDKEHTQNMAQLNDVTGWWEAAMNRSALKPVVAEVESTKSEAPSMMSSKTESTVSETFGAEEHTEKVGSVVSASGDAEFVVSVVEEAVQEGPVEETVHEMSVEKTVHNVAVEKTVDEAAEKRALGSALAMLGAMFGKRA